MPIMKVKCSHCDGYGTIVHWEGYDEEYLSNCPICNGKKYIERFIEPTYSGPDACENCGVCMDHVDDKTIKEYSENGCDIIETQYFLQCPCCGRRKGPLNNTAIGF